MKYIYVIFFVNIRHTKDLFKKRGIVDVLRIRLKKYKNGVGKIPAQSSKRKLGIPSTMSVLAPIG